MSKAYLLAGLRITPTGVVCEGFKLFSEPCPTASYDMVWAEVHSCKGVDYHDAREKLVKALKHFYPKIVPYTYI